ncbi:MAG: RNA polymerase sigma factor [Myxococcales bacterium]|nr:RNA polymerase sigma factor [Myxococcales bacterium]
MAGLDPVYRRFFPLIREKCSRILGRSGEAEEVAQETLLRLWRRGPVQGSVATVTAWIHRTATRLSIDQIRRRTLAQQAAAAVSPVTLPAGPGRIALDELVRRVPPKQLEVVLLHRVDGLTQAEVAELLGISDRHVRRTLAAFDRQLEEVV